jgi:hypothetical protein
MDRHDPQVKEAADQIRARGQRVSPYRLGCQMTRNELAAFEEWRDLSMATKDFSIPRPPSAKNPYVVNRVSVRLWHQGRQNTLREWELTPRPRKPA